MLITYSNRSSVFASEKPLRIRIKLELLGVLFREFRLYASHIFWANKRSIMAWMVKRALDLLESLGFQSPNEQRR